MFAWKLCTTILNETYQTGWRLVDIAQYQIASTKNYFKLRRRKAHLKKMMDNSNSYSEWESFAKEYDRLQGTQSWKEKNACNQYDWKYIQHITKMLKECRESDNFMEVIHIIRSNAARNSGNILDPVLYSKAYVGTKKLIEDFQQEMVMCLEYITSLPPVKLTRSKKLEFFSETRQCFGRTALIFSGGGGLGKYHYGIIKSLVELDLVPRVVAGSSIGSVFASFLCTKNAEEIQEMLIPEKLDFSPYQRAKGKSIFHKIKRFLIEGTFLDYRVGRDFMIANIGNITFQEAYDKTGLILNITITGYEEHDNFKLLNYLTAPNVVVWSAVCASCALPHVFGPADLYYKDENGQINLYLPANKKFVDGSISADIPFQYLSEMFNVNNFIVSQVNPWVVPFLTPSEELRYSNLNFLYKAYELLKEFIGSEIKHRVNQFAKIGMLPKTMTRYFNLVTQNYHGHVTIFPKPTLYDYATLLDNPRPDTMRQGLILGAKRVYPKVTQIKAILQVENALEKNYKMIKSSLESIILLQELEELEAEENS